MATGRTKIARAEKLWERLHSSLFDFQATLIEIIDTKAWEPLGYESFSKAWIEKMADITIGAELLGHVVYELLDEELAVEEVVDVLKGVGPERVERFAEEKAAGVPAAEATGTTVVRRHRRSLPGKPSHLHIEVDSATLKRWQRIAKKRGVTVQAVALPAVAAAFDGLAGGGDAV